MQVFGAVLLLATANALPTFNSALDNQWEAYKMDFNKSYTAAEEWSRREAFEMNVKAIDEMNEAEDSDAVFGLTKFSDLTADEFKQRHMGYVRQPHNGITIDLAELPSNITVPTSVDWRQKGAVSKVKDQGQCGSCWAFSTTEEVESAVFMSTGKLPVLSTQQIVSCDKQDLGCNGGDTVSAYAYLKKAGGLDTASDYPDKSHKSGKSGRCSWDKKTAAKVSGFSYAVKPCSKGKCNNQDEDALAAALATKGPISICVNAGGNGWQNYKRGVYTKKCSGAANKMDHCVQLVGFNKEGSQPYWIVRNSWNTDWGIEGYMHLPMGKNACGIANEATIAQAS
jgi:C1A family cysteine protease